MKAKKGGLTRGRVYREALGILVLALSVFTFLSLLSFDPAERGRVAHASEAPDLDAVYRDAATAVAASHDTGTSHGNLCGPAGRFIAGHLVRGIGAAAYLAVALVSFWALSLLVRSRFDAPFVRVAGGMLLILAAATAATFLQLGHLGGWLGAFFHAEMASRFSLPGSTILLTSAALIGLLLTTDFLPLTAAWKAIRLARRPAAAAEVTIRESSAAAVAHGSRVLRDRTRGLLAFLRAPWRRERQAPAGRSSGGTSAGAAERRTRSRRRSRRAAAPSSEATTSVAAGDSDVVAISAGEDEEASPGTGPAARPPREPRVRTHRALTGSGEDSAAGASRLRGLMGGAVARRSAGGAARSGSPEERPDDGSGYRLPPLDLLEAPSYPDLKGVEDSIRQITSRLVAALRNFKVEGEVVEVDRGPVISLYEVELAAGIKVQKVVNLADDLAMALKNPVRIVAPLPGKSTVGIEVPNEIRETVRLSELAMTDQFQRSIQAIPFILGKDASGHPIIEDLAQMPHLLIAGATGSGKSICINSVIMSILLSRTPDQVQMILIDPKMVELSLFKKIPHLITPVVTDMKRVPVILEWAVAKMEERYALLADMGVKNIAGYNDLGEKKVRERAAEMDADPESIPSHLPYIVIIVDELADLMMIASKEIENSLTRLAQKSRAVGIHIIFATQRPSVDVVTGLIKANFPARISFRVSSKVDSRTILDGIGSERLLGSGDLLYLPPRSANLVRCQGAYVSELEIKNVVNYVKQDSEPRFNPELEEYEDECAGSKDGSSKRDPLFDDAVRFILETNRGSVSLLQRRFEIGYSRAARLIDQMADAGIVGKYKGSKAREVLVTLDEWESKNA